MDPRVEVKAKEICPFCAVEVREGAAFCFNCGKALGGSQEEVERLAGHEPEAPAPEAPSVPETVHEESARRPKIYSDSPSESRVRVAPASARRRPRPATKRESDSNWVKPVEGPGAPFVLGALGVGVVSILILMVALYLR